MVFHHSIRNQDRNWYQKVDGFVMDPDHVFREDCGRTLELRTRKVIECSGL